MTTTKNSEKLSKFQPPIVPRCCKRDVVGVIGASELTSYLRKELLYLLEYF